MDGNRGRKFVTLAAVAGFAFLLDYVSPRVVAYGLRYLVAHQIWIRQLWQVEAMGLLPTLQSAACNIWMLICTAVFVCVLVKTKWYAAGARNIAGNSFCPRKMLLSCAMGFGAAEFVIAALNLLPAHMQAAYSSAMPSVGDVPLSFAAAFAAANIVLAPVTEEIIFRGVLYRWFRNSWGRIPSIVYISIVFAAGHSNLVQIGYALIMGLILCTIREWYGSVMYTVGFHIAFNLFGSGIFFTGWAFPLMGVGVAVFVVSLVLFVVSVRKQAQQVQ